MIDSFGLQCELCGEDPCYDDEGDSCVWDFECDDPYGCHLGEDFFYCGPDITDIIKNHFNTWIRRGESGNLEGWQFWNIADSIRELGEIATENANTILAAANEMRKPCPTGNRCKGTITFCDNCFAAYHVRHFLWMVYVTVNYTDIAAWYSGWYREESDPDWWSPSDMEANRFGRCIAKYLYPEWSFYVGQGNVLEEVVVPAMYLSREEMCGCIDEINMDLIGSKPTGNIFVPLEDQGQNLGYNIICSPCPYQPDNTPGLILPPIDLMPN